MFTCPHCQKKGISIAQKLCLSLFSKFYSSAKCKYCKNKVTSPIILTLLFYLLWVAVLQYSPWQNAFLLISSCVVLILAFIFLIPLNKYPY
jgi:hypothetical protein